MQMSDHRSCFVSMFLLLAASPGFAQGPPVAPVRHAEAIIHDVTKMIQLPGTLESPRTSLVASEVAGIVIEMAAREGTAVTKGDMLVRLSSSNLDLELRGLDGELREAAARLERARSAYDRAKNLHSESLLSEDEYDEAHAELTAWQGRADKLEAQLERVRLDLRRCRIVAPYGGVVVSESCDLGEWISVGEPVIELVATDELDVRVEVPEQHFNGIKRGSNARVTIEAIPGYEVQGTVDALIPRADPRARTFPIKIRVPNPEGLLNAGMLGKAFLPVGRTKKMLIVPKDAVVSLGFGVSVFIISPDSTVAQVSITTGEGYGDWIVVQGDVQPGQQVVVRGNERLRPGQKVSGESLDYDLP